MMHETAVLLHNVRSAHNVGAIFRTADAAGVSRIYLTGYTPLPRDRFGRVQKEIAKTALGAEGFVPWESAATPATIIDRLRSRGWRIVGVEQDGSSREFREFRIKQPTLFLFGNEVRGLSAQLLRSCDESIEIPMRGRKESLNVAVATGIILFGVGR